MANAVTSVWNGWAEMRTPPREDRPPRTYEPDPAAVANLKRILAEKEAAKAAALPAEEPAPVVEVNVVKEPEEEPKMAYKRDSKKFENLSEKDVARWAALRRAGRSAKWIQDNDELHPSDYALRKYLPEYGYDLKGEPATAATESPAMPAGIIDVAATARYMHTSEDTVLRKIKSGALPAVKVGSKWAVDQADVEALRMEEDCEGAEAEAGTELAVPPAVESSLPAVQEVGELAGQLAALEALLNTLEAGDLRVSGRMVVELNVELTF